MADSAEISFSSADQESRSSGKVGSGITPALRACTSNFFGEAAQADQSAGAASDPTPLTSDSLAAAQMHIAPPLPNPTNQI